MTDPKLIIENTGDEIADLIAEYASEHLPEGEWQEWRNVYKYDDDEWKAYRVALTDALIEHVNQLYSIRMEELREAMDEAKDTITAVLDPQTA